MDRKRCLGSAGPRGSEAMDQFITTIVAALAAGATASLKGIVSDAVTGSYNGLRALLIRKLGKSGAVQSIEDAPESTAAQATLAEALAESGLHGDTELKDLAERLEKAITEAKAVGLPGAGDIEIQGIRGHVNATVEGLIASGRIRVGPVVAETGDARVSGIMTVPLKKN
jgi:hypothetical protein